MANLYIACPTKQVDSDTLFEIGRQIELGESSGTTPFLWKLK